MVRHLALLLLGSAALPQIAMAQTSASDFTTAYRYDAMRRITGTIRPDPDDTRPIKYGAERNTYDGMGRLKKVEKGELAAWQSDAIAPSAWSNFTIFQIIETEYDNRGRKTKEIVKDGASPYASLKVTQYSYDALDRLECTAVRMNPAVFGSLPSSACDMGTRGTGSGDFGPDRITKNIYDAAGQLLQIRKGVGATSPALEQAYVTYGYSDNGKQRFVVDANGNKAEYVYDGFDRLSRWKFPSQTLPSSFNPSTPANALSTSGAVSSSDYEEYGYDANSNITSLRKREGLSFGFTYDVSNRMTIKVVPERSGLSATHTRDVYYEYDLLGALTKARFDSISGEGITNEYDGFGRLKKAIVNMGGYSRALEYENDPNGNRWRVKHPDGNYFDYAFDKLDRMYYANQNSGLGLFETAFNSKGLTSTTHRTNNNHSVYAYDAAYRLKDLANAFIGSTGTVEYTYARNPADQIINKVRNNDAYAYLDNVNVSRAYTKNGLNQYLTAGAATFGYDGNGNLASDGTSTYVYDLENRLVSASGAASIGLLYDPFGRLFQISGGSAGTTQFLYDGDALVAEYSSTNTVLRRYVHGAGPDEPLVWYEGSSLSAPKYLHADHQGSITAIANADGTLSTINSYDEYGIPSSGAVGRFRYTGQVWLDELGMYYYKARMYSSTLGRFMQTDPIGYDDQMNLYSYVDNDPLNMVDPTGEKEECRVNSEGIMVCTDDEDIVVVGDRSSITSDSDFPSFSDIFSGAKVLYCSLPSIGLGGTASGYAGLGGGVSLEVAFDPKSGVFGISGGLNVGVGIGISSSVTGTSGRGVSKGWSGSVGANANARIPGMRGGVSATLIDKKGFNPKFNGVNGGFAPGVGATINANATVRGGVAVQVMPSC